MTISTCVALIHYKITIRDVVLGVLKLVLFSSVFYEQYQNNKADKIYSSEKSDQVREPHQIHGNGPHFILFILL